MNRKEEQELVSQMTKYDRKQYFRAKKERRDKRNALIGKIMGCIVSIFVVFLIGVSVYRSFQPVYTIGTEKLDNEEYNFYYTIFTNNYINQNYYYLSYFGLDFEKSLSEQVYNSETGETWQDFFYKKADLQIQEVLSSKIEAEKNDYVCDDLDAQVTEFIDEMKEVAVESEVDFNTYIKSLFGNGMSESKLKEYVSDYLYAMDYSLMMYDSFEVSEDEINATYNEAKEDYDRVDYLCYTVVPKTSSSATDEENATAEAEAKELANTLFDKIKNGEDFATVINSSIDEDAEDKESYEDGSAITFTNVGNDEIASVVSEWLFDESRKEGDIELLENENSGYFYIVKFNNRYIDETKTVDVRHILVAFEYDDNDKLVEGTEDEAKAKIEEIKALYEADPTIENFEKLVEEYSDDSPEGGLYEGVAKSDMVEEFEEWIFDEARIPEEIGIVKTDYGYHLMYFVGDNDPSYIVEIREALNEEKYEAWLDGVLIDYVKNE